MPPDLTSHARLAVREDLVDLLGIYDETRAHEPTDEEQRTWARMLATEGLLVHVAEVGADLVGTATLQVMPNLTYDCEPTAFIEAVVVCEQWRRQGIATLLLERVLADARTRGCNKIQLLSHKRHRHDGGHALYEKLGFAAEAEGFRLYLTRTPRKVAEHRSRGGPPPSGRTLEMTGCPYGTATRTTNKTHVQR